MSDERDDFRALLYERHRATVEEIGKVLTEVRDLKMLVRQQNGRIYTLEKNQAVLEAKTDALDHRKGASMGWTATVAAIVAGIIQGAAAMLGSSK